MNENKRNAPVAKIGGIALVALMMSANAFAIGGNYIPTDLSGLASSDVDSLIKFVGLGASHRDYMPASPQGLLGVDVGIEVDAISLPSAAISAIQLATGSSNVPGLVPVAKVNVHKGLPWGLDVGASFMSLSDPQNSSLTLFKSIGASGQYSIFHNMLLGDLAARASYTTTTLFFLATKTENLDFVYSKGFMLLEPYVGAGMQFWSGNINVPVNLGAGQQLNVSANGSGATPHFFVGVPLKLLLLHATAEYNVTTGGGSTYGLKVGVGF